MKRPRLRSGLATAALLVLVAMAWWYLAPTTLGGATRYVATSGTSMEPRFHTGDLAVIRPAGHYDVGEIVAYKSSLLHVTVLHRIVAREGDLYTFKGDHNDFLDPVRPTRSELLGTLWFRVPHGGLVLRWLHAPLTVGAIGGAIGLFILFGAGETRRRRRRRRSLPTDPGHKALLVSVRDRTANLPVSPGALLTGAGIAGVLFLIVTVAAFTRPASKPDPRTVSYSQQVSFGYRASARAGLVYPMGSVRTGDPIFTQLVHGLTFQARYHFATMAPHSVGGTEQIELKLVGPGNWSRSLPLGPVTHFNGDTGTARVAVDLNRVQGVMDQLGRLIGTPQAGGFTFGLTDHVQVRGRVAGKPIRSGFDPTLGLGFNGVQVQPGASLSTTGSAANSPSGLTHTKSGSVAMNGNAPNGVSVLGINLPVTALRCIGLLGLLLAAVTAAVAFVIRRGEPFEETVRIQSRYGHLIVPVVLEGNDLGWPAVDVTSIKALVRLAESGQRLILHRPDPGGDTFLVNDEGTVYRYQVQPSNVVWGEWRPTAPRSVATAAAEPLATDEMSADSSIA